MARTRRRKKRTHIPAGEEPGKSPAPKSFVFGRGDHASIMKPLETDLRKTMEPHTAANLKKVVQESRRNQLKDFVDVAGPLGISHFLILTATEQANYLRLAKTPRGPTLTMQIHSYSLMSDVLASQQRPRAPKSLWDTSPLVVMNNFTGSEELKLASVLFQNLFPPINVQTARLSACQRVLLLSFDKETGRISLRQFGITAQPSGVSKSVKALIGKRQLPDLGNFEDVAEFLTKNGYGSESEGEEAGESRVTLPQNLGRGNLATRQSRVQLHEVGPRLELEIIKAEEGMCSGKVLYHKHIHLSQQQVNEKTTEIKSKDALREKRRKQQEENVRKKEAAKRKADELKDAGKGRGSKKAKRASWDKGTGKQEVEADDDAEYYRQEVGEEPDDLQAARNATRQKQPQSRSSDRDTSKKIGKKIQESESNKQRSDRGKKRKA